MGEKLPRGLRPAPPPVAAASGSHVHTHVLVRVPRKLTLTSVPHWPGSGRLDSMSGDSPLMSLSIPGPEGVPGCVFVSGCIRVKSSFPSFGAEVTRRAWTGCHFCPALGQCLLGFISFSRFLPRDRPAFAGLFWGLPAVGRPSYLRKRTCVRWPPEVIPRLLPSPRLKPFHPLGAPAAPWPDPSPGVAARTPSVACRESGVHQEGGLFRELRCCRRNTPQGAGLWRPHREGRFPQRRFPCSDPGPRSRVGGPGARGPLCPRGLCAPGAGAGPGTQWVLFVPSASGFLSTGPSAQWEPLPVAGGKVLPAEVVSPLPTWLSLGQVGGLLRRSGGSPVAAIVKHPLPLPPSASSPLAPRPRFSSPSRALGPRCFVRCRSISWNLPRALLALQ